MPECRVRHGIKLFERKCRTCKQVRFWVPKSSPQKFCSVDCTLNGGPGKKWTPTYIRTKRKVNYDLKEDDYE